MHEHVISSQQELQERLAKAGIEVTQATLSRDLQQLGVLKGAGGYVMPGDQNHAVPAVDIGKDVLERTLRRELRSIEQAENLVVIRTDVGHANALAVEIDRVRWPEILGTIAGDDTILLVTKRAEGAAKLTKRLTSLASVN